MIKPDILIKKGILIANLSILAGATSMAAPMQDRDVSPKPGLGGEACSFDPDCPTTDRPYCNIVYDSSGNYGVCGAVDQEEPLHVLGEEECPVGTTRQLVYKYEGDEAVCLE